MVATRIVNNDVVVDLPEGRILLPAAEYSAETMASFQCPSQDHLLHHLVFEAVKGEFTHGSHCVGQNPVYVEDRRFLSAFVFTNIQGQLLTVEHWKSRFNGETFHSWVVRPYECLRRWEQTLRDFRPTDPKWEERDIFITHILKAPQGARG